MIRPVEYYKIDKVYFFNDNELQSDIIEKELRKQLKKQGFELKENLYLCEDARFIEKTENGKIVLEYLDVENKNDVKVKEVRFIKNLFDLKDGNVVVFKDNFYQLNKKSELIDFIVKNYKLDYLKFDAEKWAKELVDYPKNIEQIKGRVVKLTYNPVSHWYGDGLREDNNIRSSVENKEITKILFYDKGLDEKKELEFLKEIINSKVFEKLNKKNIEINLKELKQNYFNKRDEESKKIIAEYKSKSDTYFYVNSLLNDINNNYQTGHLLNKEIISRLHKDISRLNDFSYIIDFSLDKNIRFYAFKQIQQELIEKYNKMIDNFNFYENKNLVLLVPKIYNKENLFVKSKTKHLGFFIGKNGNNLKETAKELGFNKIIVKNELDYNLLKQTTLYQDFIKKTDKQAPSDKEEYQKWLDNNPYSDEKFEEWVKENFTDLEIYQKIKKAQLQQQGIKSEIKRKL